MDDIFVSLLTNNKIQEAKNIIQVNPNKSLFSVLKMLYRQPPFQDKHVRVPFDETWDGDKVFSQNMVLSEFLFLLGDIAIPHLSIALLDPRLDVRESAHHALNRMGDKSKPAIDNLIYLLKNVPDARCSAINTLGDIGPSAKNALPLILPLLSDSDCRVRMCVIISISKIAIHDNCVHEILRRFSKEDPDSDVREIAEYYLCRSTP